jgi:hypothetical protein
VRADVFSVAAETEDRELVAAMQATIMCLRMKDEGGRMKAEG